MVRQIEVTQWLPDAFEDTALSEEEKTEIANQETGAITLTWLPDRVHLRDDLTNGFALESVLLIALGVAAGEFFKGALGEAGKDAWNVVKSVVGKTFHKQGQRSYQLQTRAYLILDWEGRPVRFRILQSMSSMGEPLENFEDKCDAVLSRLSGHWDEIETSLAEVAAESPSAPRSYEVILTKDSFFVERLDRLPEDEGEAFEEDSDFP